MRKINVKSLHIKVSLSVAAAALIVMSISAVIFYKRSYESSLAMSELSVNQLLHTVSLTAAIAAYVDNEELAQQVVNGLTQNTIVAGAEIINNQQQLLSHQGKPIDAENTELISLNLKGPFDENEMVGSLRVSPNFVLIAKQARSSATDAIVGLAVYAVIVTLLVLALVYWMMSHPLSHLSRTLHNITPGKGDRLKIDAQHNRDEIGLLIGDINNLLDTVEKMLTEERQLRHRVEVLEHRFRGLFEDSSAGIFLVHENGQLVTANPAFFKLTHRSPPTEESENPLNIVKDIFVQYEQALAIIKLALVSKRPCSLDLQINTKDKKAVQWAHCVFSPTGESEPRPIIEGVMYDITQRRIAEEQTRLLAEFDTLTGLANRQTVENALKDLVENRATKSKGFVAMLIDLDGFKLINDTYGHDAGDSVLRKVSERLCKNVRDSDLVARLGGDEFLIVLTHTDNVERIKIIANNILKDQQQEIEVQPGCFDSVGMSIGISFFSLKEDNETSILKHADQAMYAVKHRGKNGYAIYNSSGEHFVSMLPRH